MANCLVVLFCCIKQKLLDNLKTTVLYRINTYLQVFAFRLVSITVSRCLLKCPINIFDVGAFPHKTVVTREVVSFSTPSGPIQLWEGTESSEPIPFRESHPYSRGLRLYRWHPSVPGRLAVAHNDAKITLYKEGRCPGNTVFLSNDNVVKLAGIYMLYK